MLNKKALKSALARQGLSMSAMAKKLGMANDTFYRKVRTDGFYTHEADKINKALGGCNIIEIFLMKKYLNKTHGTHMTKLHN